MRKPQYHFLCTSERPSRLVTLRGQTLKGKPVTEGVIVTGCEGVRKLYPAGSIFGTTTLKSVTKGFASFYSVEDLVYLGENDPYPDILTAPLKTVLMDEFEKYLSTLK